MLKVSSWGGLAAMPHHVLQLTPSGLNDLRSLSDAESGVAFGMGRSYGDVCLNPNGALWQTSGLDRFICFDDETGRLRCAAGVLLSDIQCLFVPRGWALPVTPGTQLITVGGAIANDVHGKNHHVAGSFGDHVHGIRLVRTNGEIIDCGPDYSADWFRATVGGLGLTGVISEVELQLQSVSGPWLTVESESYESLSEFFEMSSAAENDSDYIVSWVDCLAGGEGRGIFSKANQSEAPANVPPLPRKSKYKVPFTPPFSLVNGLSLWCFNQLYYAIHKSKSGKNIQYYTTFFYPLDNLQHWNRMYGKKGFYQYQCVIPPEHSELAISAMLKVISDSGEGSFLSVLKKFGQREALGLLSFPMPGVTLALDFPNRGSRTHRLFNKLDQIVSESNGRLYLAKDARMSRSLFEKGYPKLQQFLAYRDPGIQSALSRRLID